VSHDKRDSLTNAPTDRFQEHEQSSSVENHRTLNHAQEPALTGENDLEDFGL